MARPTHLGYNWLVPAHAGRVRVFVADDHPLVREGLLRAVGDEPRLELVGSAANGREALEGIRDLRPDVALLDVKMPELDGIAVVRAVAREALDTRVVFLSAYVDSAVAYRALAEGAAGFLSKEASAKAVCEAIVAAARGETVMSSEVQSGIAEEIRLRAAPERLSLSARENEVLVLIADGLSAPDIGKRLHLSPATVKGHLQSLYEKLGVSERAAAVAEAMRRGLLE
ncbi:MAG: two-component system, NarL family, nitrate/nitrite response regulator NarL [Thermoleophilaceae bacterium]|nr:two-component system, NarL family, nitrate/nitrite response regulator NarL [Thermoleophilaceae bacterium]